ncbi:MAG: hypothetical protein M3440_11770 [Chloroflexota bacterium]|nr:hypothetical protein [Chloroflexota bacterium]
MKTTDVRPPDVKQQTTHTITRPWRAAAGLAVALLVGYAPVAGADSWNDKTILKFSEPVMVPGATLQPGSYVFKLMDSASSRHPVQITTEDGFKVIAVTQAVPMKRLEPKGDVVVKFNPTDAGSPIAMKGWFYPGSLYGHEFIYPDEQAKEIAQRTKTIVLSVDVPGTDLSKGTIRTYNQSAMRGEWRGDAATMREWDEWQRNRPAATASVAGARSEERSQSTAPMIQGDFQGTRVKVDELEDNAQKYMGKTISVDAEIEKVFGPRVFTIDEPNWGDLDGEILVYVPTALAALVRQDDRVTITGMVKPFVRAEVEREWGWLGLEREVEIDLAKKPVLVASRIVGGKNNVVMVINVDPAGSKPIGTSGGATASPVSDLGTIAQGDEDLVGRHVGLKGVKVESMAKDGFFVKAQNATVFVLPAHQDKTSVQAGDTVSIDGVVLQMPRKMDDRLKPPAGSNDDIYVFATSVTK